MGWKHISTIFTTPLIKNEPSTGPADQSVVPLETERMLDRADQVIKICSLPVEIELFLPVLNEFNRLQLSSCASSDPDPIKSDLNSTERNQFFQTYLPQSPPKAQITVLRKRLLVIVVVVVFIPGGGDPACMDDSIRLRAFAYLCAATAYCHSRASRLASPLSFVIHYVQITDPSFRAQWIPRICDHSRESRSPIGTGFQWNINLIIRNPLRSCFAFGCGGGGG